VCIRVDVRFVIEAIGIGGMEEKEKGGKVERESL